MNNMTAGNKIPKIRFQEFSSEWEQLKAEEIFETVDDRRHPELPVLAASQELGMVQRNKINYDISYDKKNAVTYKHVMPGQFVIHLRSFQGGFAHSDTEGITSPAYTVMDFKEKERHDDYYWKYVFSSDTFIKRLESVTYGVRDGRSISYDDFKKLEFRIPDNNEQRKIGKLLKNINRLILNKTVKYSKLLKIKKTLIKKIFVEEGMEEPAIRLKEFSGSWKRHKLSDIADIIGGGTPNTDVPEYWDGDIDWYSPTDIGNNVYLNCATKKITKLGLKKSSARILPANKTILFTSRAGIGNMAILQKAGATNQGFQSLVIHDGYDIYFIYSAGCLIKKYALSNASGSTFLEISPTVLGNMEIMIPDEKEQKAIGNYFRQLDHHIYLYQQELSKIEKLKIALIDKMFI